MSVNIPTKWMWQHQTDAVLTQVAAVQNTWYCILPATKDVRINGTYVWMSDNVETLELRMTIDAHIYTASQAGAVAGSIYCIQQNELNGIAFGGADAWPSQYRAFLYEGQNIAIDARKTTVVGAGTLHGKAIWQRLLLT